MLTDPAGGWPGFLVTCTYGPRPHRLNDHPPDTSEWGRCCLNPTPAGTGR